MPQSWELSVEAGGVWAPGKQMHVLSQESCQQLPADALEKQCHLIHHSPPPLLYDKYFLRQDTSLVGR